MFNKTVLVIAALVVSSSVNSATMLQPVDVISSIGSTANFEIGKTIDQSGLFDSNGLPVTYVSGVTGFTSFVTSVTTADGSTTSVADGSNNGWFSQQAPHAITGNIDFDLGGSFAIESFALWNDPQTSALQGIDSFKLWADDNGGFTSPLLLGSFNAILTSEPDNYGQIFNFSSIDASHVRLEIVSNHGSLDFTGFSEMAFGVTVVPVPAAVWLFGSGLLGLVAVARRRS